MTQIINRIPLTVDAKTANRELNMVYLFNGIYWTENIRKNWE